MDIATAPFKINAEGVALVCGTRVTLDSVILAFLDGATAEEIAQKYPSLDLADVYSTIAYYLRNRDEVEEYLSASSLQMKKIRRMNESKFPATGVRRKLLARKTKSS